MEKKEYTDVLFIKSDELQPEFVKELEKNLINPHVLKLLTFEYTKFQENLLKKFQKIDEFEGFFLLLIE